MYCEKCDKHLPDDSLFCPYCGGDAIEEGNRDICPKCGKTIPEESEFCPYCGAEIKQNENIEQELQDICGKFYKARKKSKVLSAFVIVMSLAIVALTAINIIQYNDNKKTVNDDKINLIVKEKQLQAKDSTIDRYRSLYEDLDEDSDKWYDGYRFLIDYIVVVYDDGTGYYHYYDCDNHSSDTFWAYNIDAAKDMGYKPCPSCRY